MTERMGIDVMPSYGTCSRTKTPCVLSSDDETFCADCTRGTSTPQIVHAVAGMYGGPSKLALTE
jgi:hypothetical protein